MSVGLRRCVALPTEELWRRLVFLKQATGAKFLLLGDEFQLPPHFNLATNLSHRLEAAAHQLPRYQEVGTTGYLPDLQLEAQRSIYKAAWWSAGAALSWRSTDDPNP